MAVVFNNLAELDSASLERKLKTPRLLMASVLSRSIGLVCILAGLPFSGAMLVSAVVAYAMLRIFARPYTVYAGEPARLGASLRSTYAPSLMTVSVLGMVVNRAVLVTAPFLITAEQSGALSSLISGQQSATAVFSSGLYTMMTTRAESGPVQGWMRTVVKRTLLSSAAVSIMAAFAAPIVVALLKFNAFPDAAAWWVLLGLAIFPYTYNRKVEYELLGAGERKKALLLLSLQVSYTLIACGIAAGLSSPSGLAANSLIAETAAACTLGALRLVSRRARKNENSDARLLGS